jgi:glutaconate CoA-transferase subunit B
MPGAGPSVLISDLGIFRPDVETCEMNLTSIHPGVNVADVRDATGWALKVSGELVETAKPTDEELDCLRRLNNGSSAKATN